MRDIYRKGRLLEFIIALVISGIIGVFVLYNISVSAVSLKADNAVSRINHMIETAYKASEASDKINQKFAVNKVDLNGYYVVNSNGAWYMICSLDEIIDGGKRVHKIVMEKVQGLMTASDLGIETTNKGHSAVFLRFSSAKQNSPSSSK